MEKDDEVKLGEARLSVESDMKPHSNFVDAMLTDLYQISMAYAYWYTGRVDKPSVFDLFFRKNPFKGEFTIFAGLGEVLRYVHSFKFTDEDVKSLQDRFPDWDVGFWDWLRKIDTSQVKIYAIQPGTIVFPRVPLIRVEGPLGVCQLLETTMLVLVNFASLMTTNAARHRLAAGKNKILLEFGLRRAQGPDGAMSASMYSYMGGFDGTSNVKAATLYGFTMMGTHAHSFVSSFTSLKDLKKRTLKSSDGKEVNFVELVGVKRDLLDPDHAGNEGELAAFIAYAQAYPRGFLALVDTYDTLNSGIPNFLAVALALHDLGYKARGIRLDSGDLAYLSKQARKAFTATAEKFSVPFAKLTIVASNDLSEEVIYSLNQQGHQIDCFGIGTNLVTCKNQPALGCVYKLVELDGKPRIKLSQDVVKVTIPGRKEGYRLFNKDGNPVLDLLIPVGHQPPLPHRRVLCRHPFDANKRVYVTPSRVQPLHECVWDGKLTKPLPSLADTRKHVHEQLALMREDHLRHVNPTPYKLSLSSDLYTFMHDLWLSETPIHEIH